MSIYNGSINNYLSSRKHKKKPAILIIAVTFMMIGLLVLEFQLSNDIQCSLITDDYLELIEAVSNQESRILLIGEDLPFPVSIKHQVISDFNELSNSFLGQIDFIIIHASDQTANHSFTIELIHMLKLLNHQGVSIIFVGLSSFDFLNIDTEISANYPYGVGLIMMNPNSFGQGLYEIHAPNINNSELRLYKILLMMAPR